MEFFKNLLHFFYPPTCLHCQKKKADVESILCNDCFNELPFTRFVGEESNPVKTQLSGRFPIENACCLFYYGKLGIIQRLLEELKYHHSPEVGMFLGKLLGFHLSRSKLYQDVDYLVAVPIHESKLKKRGYNQSEVICQGIQTYFPIPVLHALKKVRTTESQTKKDHFQRWENVKDCMVLNTGTEDLQGKHLLLVDDVLTTGATLESCILPLKKIPGLRLSIATIASPIH